MLDLMKSNPKSTYHASLWQKANWV